jgi:tagatose-1,6-bisphosphate aldolase
MSDQRRTTNDDRNLSIGKLRGLQQLSDGRGIFAMCAMDHRGSLRRMLNPAAPGQVRAPDITTFKLDLAEMLAPTATAVLLDPIYGAAQAVAAGVLPGHTGLIVSAEESGYEETPAGRITTLLPDWSVAKIRRMGASGVKLLLYYRPDRAESAARQRAVVDGVAAAAADADLPFVLEPLLYALTASERSSESLGGIRADLVAQSAAELAPRGPDILKVEFPGRGLGPERWAEVCARLDETTPIPWVLLSGGAGYDEFLRWVEAACRAGASGFLGGRAVWEDAASLDRGSRRRWLQTTGADRMRRLSDIAGEFSRPWWKKYAERSSDLATPDALWYRTYGS